MTAPEKMSDEQIVNALDAAVNLAFRDFAQDMIAARAIESARDAQWQAFEQKREAVALEMERLKSTWVNPRMIAAAESERLLGKAMEREYTLADLLRRNHIPTPRTYALQMIAPLLVGVLWRETFTPVGAPPFDLPGLMAQHLDTLLGGMLTEEARG